LGDNHESTLKYILRNLFHFIQARIRSNNEKNYYLMCNNDHFFNLKFMSPIVQGAAAVTTVATMSMIEEQWAKY